jgi:hypothetical protein
MSTLPTWATLPVEQSLAMRAAASRLAVEFDGVYGQETIERFLYTLFDQFATNASVSRFLPLMAERFAQRLHALARVGAARRRAPSSSSVCTTLVGLRWRWASSMTWRATTRSRGQAGQAGSK